MVAEAFLKRGIAAHVDARECIITDAQHGRAIPDGAEIEVRCPRLLRPLLEEGSVPVLGGFIGSTPRGRDDDAGPGRLRLYRRLDRRGDAG